VERRIDLSNLDLDRVAAMVAARRSDWLALGLVADGLTWMDNDVQWPAPLVRDRSQVRRPMSLGLRVHGHANEAEFVLYAGGWADVDVVRGIDEPVSEYVELDEVEEFGLVLDRVIASLVAVD
jgi:hypothetical protein